MPAIRSCHPRCSGSVAIDQATTSHQATEAVASTEANAGSGSSTTHVVATSARLGPPQHQRAERRSAPTRRRPVRADDPQAEGQLADVPAEARDQRELHCDVQLVEGDPERRFEQDQQEAGCEGQSHPGHHAGERATPDRGEPRPLTGCVPARRLGAPAPFPLFGIHHGEGTGIPPFCSACVKETLDARRTEPPGIRAREGSSPNWNVFQFGARGYRSAHEGDRVGRRAGDGRDRARAP